MFPPQPADAPLYCCYCTHQLKLAQRYILNPILQTLVSLTLLLQRFRNHHQQTYLSFEHLLMFFDTCNFSSYCLLDVISFRYVKHSTSGGTMDCVRQKMVTEYLSLEKWNQCTSLTKVDSTKILEV